MRTILFSIFILLLFTEIIHSESFSNSQDSLINRTITTKEFNLRTYGIKHNLIYKECDKIIPASDTSFYAGEKSNSKLVLYKDIRRIDFQSDKRRTWEGVWKGGLTGVLGGIMVMTFFQKAFYPTGSTEGGWGLLNALLYESVFILGGSAIGGYIGSLSFYTDYYDLVKYKPEQRKEKALRLFLKYKVNF